jgi:TRAP-type mannitol/chloroaromatic compound transport system permease large subunit
MLVVMGPVLGVSVVHLFAAAIIPGIILSGLYMAYAMFRSFANPKLGPPLTQEERGASFRQILRDLLRRRHGLHHFCCWGILVGKPTDMHGRISANNPVPASLLY